MGATAVHGRLFPAGELGVNTGDQSLIDESIEFRNANCCFRLKRFRIQFAVCGWVLVQGCLLQSEWQIGLSSNTLLPHSEGVG